MAIYSPVLPGFSSTADKFIADFAMGPKTMRVSPSTENAALSEDVLGSPPEPVFDTKAQDDIQGNILPGFNKDHQQFLFLKIDDPALAKRFLKWLVPYLTSMEEVLTFRSLLRSKRQKHGRRQVHLNATWVNLGLSHEGISKLTSQAEVDAFGDQSFKQGLAARSTYLGDPSDPAARGHASNWVVGGREKEADLVVIVASDLASEMDSLTDQIRRQSKSNGLQLLFEQRAATLAGDMRGHEHFGFKDGISQPGIRGKLSSAPGDYITPRYIANTDERRFYFAKPGQLLLWPGQILLGEPRQDSENVINSTNPASKFPAWARHGAYLVVRRLHQDVRTFWSFAHSAAAQIGLDALKFASMLVGRWPSGAPLLRSPDSDNPDLGKDDFANNHFIYDDNTRPSELKPIPGYAGDTFPDAMADFLAKVCPHFAHIRKVNPRDSVTELGKPADSLTHMILRRGIPYGSALMGVKTPDQKLYDAERGLMFVAYGSSIENQFEFLQRRWSNSAVQPNLGGYDPIIGANGSEPARERFIDFPTATGSVRIQFKDEWVIPTGGGYFFAPTISAISDVFSVV